MGDSASEMLYGKAKFLVSVVDGESLVDDFLTRPNGLSESVNTLLTWSTLGWNHAVCVAIAGYREEAARLADFCKRTALNLAQKTAESGGFELWTAWDIAFLSDWLLSGHEDPYLMMQRVRAYALMARGGPGEDDTTQEEIIRLLDVGDINSARTLLKRDGTIGNRLTPWQALTFAIQTMSGDPAPKEFQLRFQTMIRTMRNTHFRDGLFCQLVPWARLYGRLYTGETDPFRVLEILK